MCELFRLKGWPKKNRPLQKNRETLERLDLSTSKSWSDPQPLDPSRFLEPSQGITLSDLQCQKCMCVADRPIQTGCDKLMCYTCVAAHLHTEGPYPCCGKDHQTASLSPAGDVVVKIIGTLLLRCSDCGSTVELGRMREHRESKCAVVVPPSPSRLTLRQIMSQLADAPPTVVEKKLANSVVKRIMNTSAHQSSSSSADLVTLPTAGQVTLPYKYMYMYVDRPSTVHVKCMSSMLVKILFGAAQLIGFCLRSLLPFLILMHNRAEHTCMVVFNSSPPVLCV